ncbi:MAG: hypothetical protein PWP06_1069 [Candidatus Marinimicrobia bacterium]|nr:hypothetical protein [Candidatus Neomarinimicrobiota bacterium]
MNDLRIYPLKIYLKAQENLSLPSFATNTIRGAFGYNLKNLACVYRNVKRNCKKCILRKSCVYSRIFESTIDNIHIENSNLNNLLKDVPDPFIFYIPSEINRFQVKANKMFYIDIVLIGNIIEDLPWFIVTFNHLQESGLGKNFQKVIVDSVEHFSGQIYSSVSETLINYLPGLPEDVLLPDSDISKLTLHFITPLRLRIQNNVVDSLGKQLFWNAIVRRWFLVNEVWNVSSSYKDYEYYFKLHHQITDFKSDMKWTRYRRYSTRQKKWINLSGLQGQVTLSGSLNELYPILKLTEYINVGKSTSYGMGKFKILRG